MAIPIYKRTTTRTELEEIRNLQLANSVANIGSDEKEREGFVTVQHTVALLEKMNAECAHIVAKDQDKVVGFALAMLPSFRNQIEILIPMFERIDTLLPKDKTFLVMGQICIAKTHRKQGVFRGMYDCYRKELNHKFDFLVTEIASNNSRSMQAHQAIGFRIISSYEENGVVWNIVLWDWK